MPDDPVPPIQSPEKLEALAAADLDQISILLMDFQANPKAADVTRIIEPIRRTLIRVGATLEMLPAAEPRWTLTDRLQHLRSRFAALREQADK